MSVSLASLTFKMIQFKKHYLLKHHQKVTSQEHCKPRSSATSKQHHKIVSKTNYEQANQLQITTFFISNNNEDQWWHEENRIDKMIIKLLMGI